MKVFWISKGKVHLMGIDLWFRKKLAEHLSFDGAKHTLVWYDTLTVSTATVSIADDTMMLGRYDTSWNNNCKLVHAATTKIIFISATCRGVYENTCWLVSMHFRFISTLNPYTLSPFLFFFHHPFPTSFKFFWNFFYLLFPACININPVLDYIAAGGCCRLVLIHAFLWKVHVCIVNGRFSAFDKVNNNR